LFGQSSVRCRGGKRKATEGRLLFEKKIKILEELTEQGAALFTLLMTTGAP
jgi:hypothetical protein